MQTTICPAACTADYLSTKHWPRLVSMAFVTIACIATRHFKLTDIGLSI